jgi:uncharacterized membrane protein YgdD (TMEM256/DUF423 family)
MNSITSKRIAVGCLLAALAVALGAFGTHSLRGMITAHYFEVFETAVRYQMFHAVAIILFGMISDTKILPSYIYLLFLTGTIIFCGTLYGIVIGSMAENNPLKWLGAITPLGGICFILAWILFAFHLIKK